MLFKVLLFLFTGSVFGADSLFVPKNLLVSSGISSTFTAQFCLFVGIILLFTVFAAKFLKYILKIPVIAGQIIAGIILGPTLLNIADWKIFSYTFTISDIVSGQSVSFISSDLFIFIILLISGAFTISYLLWLAGYETNLSEMVKVGPAATLAGILGAVVPILLTTSIIVLIFGFNCSFALALGVGLIFSATSVSIPIAMLVAQKKMHLRSSKATLGAAIIDDILAVIFLSIFIIVLQSGFFGGCNIISTEDLHTGSILGSLLKIFISFVAFFVFGFTAVSFLMKWFNKSRLYSLIPPTAFGLMLFYFSFSELIGGLAGITGAYFAGIFQRRVDEHHYSENTLSPFINAVFLPLFLASVGLQVNIAALTFHDWLITLAIFLIAVFSKIFGVYLATFISNLFFEIKRWTLFESYIFGVSMVARGEVGLVIATLLKSVGIITPSIYIICVVAIILTTIITPILLSLGFSLEKKSELDVESKIVTLGNFDLVGTENMFEMMLDLLEKAKHVGRYIKLSEGHIIADFQKDKVDIIYSPKEGITLKGRKEAVDHIIELILKGLGGDLDRIKKASQPLH